MRTHTLTGIFVVSALFVLTPLSAFASTAITDDITTDTHWTLGGSPYVITYGDPSDWGFITVASGTALTIDPGVVIKSSAHTGITILGTLVAHGTAENPIIFTSLEDDTAGGDTNEDGTSTTPKDRQWTHLQFNAGSTGSFDHTIVRYGGNFFLTFNTGIENNGGTVSIGHTILTHNGFDGFGQRSGHTTISNSDISHQSTGIMMSGGEIVVSSTRIHDSTIGIHHQNGSLLITHSELDHNDVGISVFTHGSITVSDSSIHDNATSGISNSNEIISVDAHNNWWGDVSGPYATDNAEALGNDVSGGVDYQPWLTSDPFLVPVDPCAVPGSCVSNVMFLPGIEGSRLYEGVGCGKSVEEKLWEPIGESTWEILRGAGDAKVKDLSLDATGKSICSDIYTKENDIIDAVGGSNIYASLVSEMDGLTSDGTIAAWKPVAYDWRLSLSDLLTNGTERDGKIFYNEATSTPYIEQTLRVLANSSKTGKVTIIAHSNGGLLAKALLDRLGSETTKLVDRVVMVGVPQAGAPLGMGALLFGLNQGISSWGVPILHASVARAFSGNSPMAYHLLPSDTYFGSAAIDIAHPVIRFSGDAYTKEEAAYDATITNTSELDDFLLAKDGGREKPREDNLREAEILNSVLIDYANSTHATLDPWTPPEGIEIDQIAGWGVDTVGGVDFYSLPAGSIFLSRDPVRKYRPILIEDGDGTVPVPSALMMASSTIVKRYWVNLDSYRIATSIKRTHADLFEIPQLQDLIKNLLKSDSSTLPTYISTSQPAPVTEGKKLTFFLHSPLTLELTDTSGHTTGLGVDGSMRQDISGSSYGEFGEVKYVTVSEGQYKLTMHGLASGNFSLDLQESSGGVVTSVSTIANVPATASTLASLTITGGVDTASPLVVDEYGDGKTFAVTPIPGAVVSYEPPAPVPATAVAVSSSGGGGSGSIIFTLLATTSTPKIATTSGKTATTTLAKKKSPPINSTVTPQKAKHLAVPQLASVASQQPAAHAWGAAVYNGLHGLWSALKNLF